jgi:hypothetical protein
VITAGEHVEAVAEQLVGKLRRDAEPSGGVFGVGDRKVDVFLGDDVFKMLRDDASAGRGEDITDK